MSTPGQEQVKSVAALRQKKFREQAGLILVEGRHPVEEALRAGLKLRDIFALPDHPGGMPADVLPVEPYFIHEKTMARMATTDSPPPCLAVFERPEPVCELPSAVHGSSEDILVLILDHLQDPGNLGTLIRSAIAFGVDAIVLVGDCAEFLGPKVIRASAGLVFAVPVLQVKPAALSSLLGKRNWKVYAATGDRQALPYRKVSYTGACALVLGNEGRGISEALLSGLPPVQRFEQLTIQMNHAVESLNVAVSGSVILAEAADSRRRCPEKLADE